ncbi:TIGR03663 family protein [bacterium]|nr:TIGR03663 family protein [bacterium]
MKRSSLKSYLLLITLFTAAAGFRLQRLDLRPMHTDEAVHAVKFGDYLESGQYRYDPQEYHGPTLYVFSLLPARILNITETESLSEGLLRIVPVFFGLGLILLLLPLRRGIGWTAVIASGFMTAVSPVMVFYSRYYIQETLFVFFALGMAVSGYRYALRPGWITAALSGLSAGLLAATKETGVIVFFAMGTSLAAVFALHVRAGDRGRNPHAYRKRHAAVFLASALITAGILFSSFLTHPQGILESFRSFPAYLQRASDPVHVHPWYYYFQLLGFWHVQGRPFWSEGSILLLAGAGMAGVFRSRPYPGMDRGLIRFFAFTAVILSLVFSLIPYKTPWNLLCFHQIFIVLAGIGVAVLIHRCRTVRSGILIAALLAAGAVHLVWQSALLNGRYSSDPGNPWVYSHPGGDLALISADMERLASAAPGGYETPIEIIFPDHEYWPLPWTLRHFSKTGWFSEADLTSRSAPVVLASPEAEAGLIRKLYEMPPPGQRDLYLPLFDGYRELRPGAEICGYVRKDLWDLLQQNRQTDALSSSKERRTIPAAR